MTRSDNHTGVRIGMTTEIAEGIEKPERTKYILFVYPTDEPRGGMNDLKDIFWADTDADAMLIAHKAWTEYYYTSDLWKINEDYSLSDVCRFPEV